MLLQRAHVRLTELFGPPLPAVATNVTVWNVPGAPGRRCRIFVCTTPPDLTPAWVDAGGDRPDYECVLESDSDLEELAARALSAAAAHEERVR